MTLYGLPKKLIGHCLVCSKDSFHEIVTDRSNLIVLEQRINFNTEF